jgi:ubiquitin C-terminal hydrolase
MKRIISYAKNQFATQKLAYQKYRDGLGRSATQLLEKPNCPGCYFGYLLACHLSFADLLNLFRDKTFLLLLSVWA